jgi:hypothetical protein
MFAGLSLHASPGPVALWRGEGNASDFIGDTYVTAFNLRSVDDGLSHHFALTCDDQQAILYVDGVAGPPVAAVNWVAHNSADMVLGRDTAVSGRNFSGQLDEVTIYTRALGGAEVQALAGKPALQIVATDPGQATVSWPDTASGFHLQINDTLETAGWIDAPSGTNNPVTVPTPLPARFHRLAKP